MRAYMRRGRGRVAVNLHRLRLVQHLKLNLVPHKMADHRHFYTRCPQQGTAHNLCGEQPPLQHRARGRHNHLKVTVVQIGHIGQLQPTLKPPAVSDQYRPHAGFNHWLIIHF